MARFGAPAGTGDNGALIGRSSELGELVDALDATRSGAGRFFLLTGDAGIGKTRLAEAIAEVAHAGGIGVLWGRCREAGGRAPYGPWLELFGAEHLPLHDCGPPSELPGARLALFGAVADVLAARAERAGLVVVVEDLHAADEASRRLLQFVVGRLADSHLLLVGTGDGREAVPSRQVRRFHLTGLNESGVAELLERTAPGVTVGDLARRVLHATDGNPFLVQEVARLLGSEALGSPAVAVPEDARHIIRWRLAPLAGDVREALTAATVLGEDFDLQMLSAIRDAPEQEVAGLLATAVALHIVGEESSARWSFRHALLRNALYDELRPSTRASLHRRAGEAMVVRGSGDLFELAHHFFEAARTGDGDAAVEACAAAGDRAMAAVAFEDAATLFGRALEALSLAPPVDEFRRHSLLAALAQSQERAGDMVQAGEAWRRALQSARALGEAELLGEAALGYANVAASTGGEDSRSVLEEARAILPPDDGRLLARLTVRLGAEVSRRNGQLGRGLADQALAMAQRLGDTETSWAVLSEWRSAGDDDSDRQRGRLAMTRELLALAEQAGDPARTAMAHQWMASDLFAEGDVAAAARHLALVADEAEPFLRWGRTSQQVAVALLHGRLDDAERLATEARAAGEGMDLPEVEARFEAQMRRVRMDRGRFDDVADRCRRALDTAGPRGMLHAGCRRADLAMSTLLEGRQDEARRTLADREAGAGRLCCLSGRAELCWLLDDVEHAGALYDILRPYGDRHVVSADSGCSLGACARYIGQLAALLGRFDEAETYFLGAHRLHEHLDAPAWLARSRADHARMLIRRGTPGDLDRARSLAAEAAEGFESLGMTFHAERARSIVDQGADEAPGQRLPALDRAGLRQDGDYWAFEYGGAVVRLRDGKGVRYLVRLLRQPGSEVHALDLAGSSAVVLDAEAKAAFRRRVADLRDELDEATAHNDLERAARAQDGMDRLLAEISVVAGGSGSGATTPDAERARQSVTRAVKATVDRLAEADAALGLHLRSTVRTGVYSAYVPDPRAPIVWEGE